MKPSEIVDFSILERPELAEDQKKLQENIDWAFVALSEAQELAYMGLGKEAAEKINRAKRILRGKYQILEEGFSIEVL